jgi:hypothetical protein
VLGQVGRVFRIDAAEMEEVQRLAGGEPAVGGAFERTLREIPVCRVVAVVAQDGDVAEQRRREIDPALVDRRNARPRPAAAGCRE